MNNVIDLSSSPPDGLLVAQVENRHNPSKRARTSSRDAVEVDLSCEGTCQARSPQEEAPMSRRSTPSSFARINDSMPGPSGARKTHLWGEIEDNSSAPVPRYAPPSAARFRGRRADSSMHATSNLARQSAAAEASHEPARLHSSGLAATLPLLPPSNTNPRDQPSFPQRLGRDNEDFFFQEHRVADARRAGRLRGPASDALRHVTGLGSSPSTGAQSSGRAARQAQGAWEGGGIPRAAASDAALARRLQEEEDDRLAREVARHLEEEEAQRMQARMDALEAMEEEENAFEAMISDLAAHRRGRRARGGSGAVASSSGLAPSNFFGAGRGPVGAGSGWGPMGMSALLLGGLWQGRNRHGASRGMDRGMREAVVGMVESGIPPHLLFSDRDFTADDYEALCRLDEKVENRKGATQQAIDNLPTHVARGTSAAGAGRDRQQQQPEAFTCSICLEEVVDGAVLRLLPCTHKYHKDWWVLLQAAVAQ